MAQQNDSNDMVALDNRSLIRFEEIENQPNFFWSKIGAATNTEFKIMVRKDDNFINISKFICLYAPHTKFSHWERNDNVKCFLLALEAQC